VNNQVDMIAYQIIFVGISRLLLLFHLLKDSIQKKSLILLYSEWAYSQF
jgi:hypothetical protein